MEELKNSLNLLKKEEIILLNSEHSDPHPNLED